MKHLPNVLTLANLFFGCVAIAYILNASSFLTTVTGESYTPVLGLPQLYLGSLFIGLAALCDVFDGLAARMLHATSAIGRDLDSLADVVSFGVAPAMIMYKLLWFSYMAEPGAMDISILVIAPAFLLPCFGALRLARYNQTADEQKHYFSGLPIPAMAIVVASLPLINWFPAGINFSALFYNRWLLYIMIIVLCLLMVSRIKFLKWKAAGKGLGSWWPQALIFLTIIIGHFFLKFAVIPVAFILYLILSLIFRHKNNNTQGPPQTQDL
ncbi:MAG TPA: CDP-alcohol phosphatidyltransferase family protein [Edaphocola sp.]|nr:CDP-alcohol phosphatidyltransferase family protein [Edaphocola sp.]